MVIIRGGRMSGKTTLAIKLSAKTGIPIMCMGFVGKRLLMERAKDLGLTIPEPVRWKNRQEGMSPTDNRVIIDDAEEFLQMMMQIVSGVQIEAMTMNTQVIELGKMCEGFEGAQSLKVKGINKNVYTYGNFEEKVRTEHGSE